MKKIEIAPSEQFTDDMALRLLSKFISGPHKAPPKSKPWFPPRKEEKTGSR